MRALIGPELLRKLPKTNVDIRDVKLTGFVLRCRPTGASYLVQEARGTWRTLGTVKKITPEAARQTAQAMLSGITKKAIGLMADDVMLTHGAATAQARRDIHHGRRTKRLTWRAYLTDHYEPWASEHLKTGAEMVARLRVTFAEFLDLPLTEFNAFSIERWRTIRKRSGVTAATVNRDLSALRGAFSRAKEWKLITDHPMADVKAAKVDATGIVRYLSPDEETRLRAALTTRDEERRQARETANQWRQTRGYDTFPAFGVYTDHVHPLVLTALHTGCRRGELFALKWADVDLRAALLTVTTSKSGKARVIPLNSEIAMVLKVWRPGSVRTDAYVFPGVDGAPLVDVKTAFTEVLKAAKIDGFRFHDLRHHFASRLVQAGIDLNTVRELLGHADLKMTIRYSHLAPEHKAAAVAVLVR